MVERQGAEPFVLSRKLATDDAADIFAEQRAVREHRALRRAGGAGGVEDLRDGAVGHVVVNRVAFQLHDPGEGLRGRRATGEGSFLQGFVVENQLGAGLLDDVAEFRRGKRVIGRDVDDAGLAAAEPGEEEVIRVAAEGGDAVAVVQAMGAQAPGDPAGGFVQRPVGPGPPGKPHRHLVPEAIGGAG